jgi:hypothetical protein
MPLNMNPAVNIKNVKPAVSIKNVKPAVSITIKKCKTCS